MENQKQLMRTGFINKDSSFLKTVLEDKILNEYKIKWNKDKGQFCRDTFDSLYSQTLNQLNDAGLNDYKTRNLGNHKIINVPNKGVYEINYLIDNDHNFLITEFCDKELYKLISEKLN